MIYKRNVGQTKNQQCENSICVTTLKKDSQKIKIAILTNFNIGLIPRKLER
jgi:hypothetical protein